MMKPLILVLAVFSHFISYNLATLSAFNSLIHDLKCQNYSPFFILIQDFKYGLPQIHHVKGVAFCSEYSKRTCCNHSNFEMIRSKWIRMNMYADEISEHCFTAIRQLICYDCDSDIGLGIKAGLCPRTCHTIYSACLDDYFRFNELNELGFCERNSMVCSKARDIAGTAGAFCKALGFPQNDNENVEDFLEAIAANTTVVPICFNLNPSSQLFGPAARIRDIEKNVIKLSAFSVLSIFILFLVIFLS